MESLAVEDISKNFGSVRAVESVTFQIEAGTLLSLVGPSGCGKTTTLRMIVGFIGPDRGEIRIGNTVVSAPGKVVRPERRGMSMIFQSYALWPHKTVFHNVAYGLKLRRLAPDVVRKRVMTMLDVVQMADLADRYPSELSGGQQQRVALARAIAIEPKVLVMDEPLSNLDANLREEMRLEIRRIHGELGITTVYVTHDLSEALSVSDLVAVMDKGRIVQLGAPEEIYGAPRNEFVARFMGGSNLLHLRGMEHSRAALGAALLDLERLAGRPVSVSPGEDVVLAFRPGDGELLPARGPVDTRGDFKGSVRSWGFLGDHREYMIAIDGVDVTVRVRVRADVRLAIGDEVLVRILPGRAHILNE